MLSSIHPLGERGRGNRFAKTASAFVVGSIIGGTAVGATVGLLGESVLWLFGRLAGQSIAASWSLVLVALAGLVALGFDLRGKSLPSVHRQVNEEWLVEFRGWVYGFGFGVQLGAGIATYITSAAVLLWIAAILFSGSLAASILIGATFGLARGLSIVSSRSIDTPDRLVAFHRSLHDSAAVVSTPRLSSADHADDDCGRSGYRESRLVSEDLFLVHALGVDIGLPHGWEAEVDTGSGSATDDSVVLSTPRIHLANFPLPGIRGDFGSGTVERMRSGDVLICILEEAPEYIGSALFETEGMPTLVAADFTIAGMQRPIRGQSGAQKFFHTNGRAFALYVVVGSHLSRGSFIDEINAVLRAVDLS